MTRLINLIIHDMTQESGHFVMEVRRCDPGKTEFFCFKGGNTLHRDAIARAARSALAAFLYPEYGQSSEEQVRESSTVGLVQETFSIERISHEK